MSVADALPPGEDALEAWVSVHAFSFAVRNEPLKITVERSASVQITDLVAYAISSVALLPLSEEQRSVSLYASVNVHPTPSTLHPQGRESLWNL